VITSLDTKESNEKENRETIAYQTTKEQLREKKVLEEISEEFLKDSITLKKTASEQ